VAALAGGGWWAQRQQAEAGRLRADADRKEGERRQATEAALARVADLEGQARWAEARAVLDEATERLSEADAGDLRPRLEQAGKDLDLVARLDAIRLRKAAIVANQLDYAGADRAYAAAFRDAGIGEEEEAEAAAALIQASGVRVPLVAAVDDWASATGDEARRKWLLAVARRADSEPGGWRDRFRDPEVWRRPDALAQLADEARAQLAAPLPKGPSPQLLVALGRCVRMRGGDAVPLLRAAQARHPGDFWLNFALGNALLKSRPEEAVGYYRAALAARPEASAVYTNLGAALHDLGRPDEAIDACRRAVELGPKDATTHYNLGVALAERGRLDDAIPELRMAVVLDPRDPSPHIRLGIALHDKGRFGEALDEFRNAVALGPKDPMTHYNLGVALRGRGRLDEAIDEFRAAVALDPQLEMAHCSLGDALRDAGLLDEAVAECRRAVELDPKDSKAHTNLGSALNALGRPDDAIEELRKAVELDPQLAPAHCNLGDALRVKGRTDEAIAECRKAVALDPKLAPAHNALGSALKAGGRLEAAVEEYRAALALDARYAKAHYNLGVALQALGRLDEAIEEYRKDVELDPKHVKGHYNLGNALRAEGRLDEAVAAYRQAIDLQPDYAEAHCNLGHALRERGDFAPALAALKRGHELGSARPDWRYPSAEWVRQCRRLVDLNALLPAVSDGAAEPADADAALGFAQACRLRKRFAAAARLSEAAFAAGPAWDDPRTRIRCTAACSAALAGCGRGDDAPPDEAGRAALRARALAWLRADLARWGEIAGDPTAGPAVRAALRGWRDNPQLSGVREAGALEKLPEAERVAWLSFWFDVDALLAKADAAK
jgi:tetratricopeptide (TPR) repeat protein